MLQDLDIDVDLGTRVEASFDYRFKGRFNSRCEFEHTPLILSELFLEILGA